MLKLFRRKNLLVKIFLFVIVFLVGGAMLVYLVPGAGGDVSLLERQGVLAQVGKRPVTEREVQQSYSRVAAQWGSQNPEFARIIKEQVVEEVITLHAVAYEGKRMGLQVTPEELGARLRQISTLYPGGEFVGMDAYRQFVQREFGMTVPQFEDWIRQQTLQAKMFQWVTAGMTVTPAEVQREYRRRNEAVQVEYALFDPAEFARRLAPSEEEVRQYFAQHRERYLIPEKRAVRFVGVDYNRLGRRVQVTEEELRDYYERNRQSYHRPERVKVRHILLLRSQAEAEEGESLRQQAERILQRLQAGGDFAALAQEHSQDARSREEGGEIGWVHRGQTVPALEKTIFSMSPDDPPQLVETSYGLHVVDVLEYQPERVQSLSEVRAEIEPVVKEQKVQRLAREQARQIVADVRGGQSLDEAAQAGGWEVRETPPFERDEALGPFGPDSGFQEAAFRLPADSAGQPDAPVSDPVSVAPGFAVFQLKEVQPARSAEFEEVRNKVLEAYRQERSQEEAREAAHQLAEAAGEGGLRQAARQQGIALKTSEPFARQSFVPDLGSARDIAPVAFNLSEGEVSPALPVGNKWVVFRVTGRQEADLSQLTEEGRQALHDGVLEQKRLLVWNVFQENVKKKLQGEGKLKINQEAIDRYLQRG